MRIKILNKNLQTIGDYSTAKWFNVRPGGIINENYNETLDSAEIYIDQLTSKLEIEPLDIVLLEKNDLTIKYLCVNNFSCNQVAFGVNKYYMYNITLISQTKLLEGIVLPNLKITQRKSGTKLTIKHYLDKYLDLYGQKVRKSSGSSIIFTNKWSYSSNVATKFNVECPEKQWNQPTLREVLTDLMMVKDCIPILINNVIDFIDLSKIGTEIATTNLTQTQTSQSADEYISELRCEMKNVIQSSVTGVNDIVSATESSAFRSTEEWVTDKNFYLPTINSIVEIESVKMSCGSHTYYDGLDPTPVLNIIDYDITEYILEKGEWDTKDIFFSDTSNPTVDDLGKYQQTTLYFNRYSPGIQNWTCTTSYKTLFQTISFNLVSLLLQKACNDLGISHTVQYSDTLSYIRGMVFTVKYKTSASALLSAGKVNKPSNERIVTDNQSFSFVDPFSQGLLEYMKANRLGNELTLIEGRYKPTDTLPVIGQTYEGNIIFKTQYSYYDDYILGNFWATPEYVMKDYFTGVQAKIRSWKIVDGSEALERHDLIKYYLEFNYKETNEIETTVALLRSQNIDNYFLQDFIINTIKVMDICGVKFEDSAGNFYPKIVYTGYPIDYYLTDLAVRLSGNSLLFTFGYDDNFKAGSTAYPGLSMVTPATFGIQQLPYRYVDSNGENIGGKIVLSNYIDSKIAQSNRTHTSSLYPALDSEGVIIRKNYVDVMTIRPACMESEIKVSGHTYFEIPFYFNKDNSEITRITTQFEFCSASDDLVFGTQFLKNLQAIRTITHPLSFSFYYSDTKPSFRDKDKLPDDAVLYDTGTQTITVTNNYILFTFSVRPQSVIKYFYVTLGTTVILAFKNSTETEQKIYLNLLKIRDKNIYDNNGVIIDEIGNITSIYIPYKQNGVSSVVYDYIDEEGNPQTINATSSTQTIQIQNRSSITYVATADSSYDVVLEINSWSSYRETITPVNGQTMPIMYAKYKNPRIQSHTSSNTTISVNFNNSGLKQVEISTDSSFATILQTVDGYDTATFTNLTADTTYYIRAKALESGGIKASSGYGTIYTAQTQSGTPDLELTWYCSNTKEKLSIKNVNSNSVVINSISGTFLNNATGLSDTITSGNTKIYGPQTSSISMNPPDTKTITITYTIGGTSKTVPFVCTKQPI